MNIVTKILLFFVILIVGGLGIAYGMSLTLSFITFPEAIKAVSGTILISLSFGGILLTIIYLVESNTKK